MKNKIYFNYDDYGLNQFTNSSIKESLKNLRKLFFTINYKIAVSHIENNLGKCYIKNLTNCENNLHFDFSEFFNISGKKQKELNDEILRQYNNFKQSNGFPDRIDFHQNMHKNFKLMRVVNNSKEIKKFKLRPLIQFPLSNNLFYSIAKYSFTFVYQFISKRIFKNLNFGDELVITNIHKVNRQNLQSLFVFNKIFKYDLLIPMHPHIYKESEDLFINLLFEKIEI